MADANSTCPTSHRTVYAELWEIFFAQQCCATAMRLLEGPTREARDQLRGLIIAIERLAAEAARIAEVARDRCPIVEEPTPEPRA